LATFHLGGDGCTTPEKINDPPVFDDKIAITDTLLET
jgi:hypothetical protein